MWLEADEMSVVIRAHFDGKNIVPEEPVDLPINQSIEVEFRIPEQKLSDTEIERRLAAVKRFAARAVKGANIPPEELRREKMYEPPRGL
jgi:hypothetical protein